MAVGSTDAAAIEASPLIPTDNTFDFGLETDPFGQRGDPKSLAKVLHGRLASARTSGRLNIAAMNLREIPADVMNMYSSEAVGTNDGSWAESVDLTRFVAADNELEMIDDSVFPDVNPSEYSEEEESQGNIFGGLETLDLHGNMLIALPLGLRRLELLTSLNLVCKHCSTLLVPAEPGWNTNPSPAVPKQSCQQLSRSCLPDQVAEGSEARWESAVWTS